MLSSRKLLSQLCNNHETHFFNGGFMQSPGLIMNCQHCTCPIKSNLEVCKPVRKKLFMHLKLLKDELRPTQMQLNVQSPSQTDKLIRSAYSMSIIDHLHLIYARF